SRQTSNLLGLALLVEVTRRRQDGDRAGDRADSGQPGEPFFQQVQALDRLATLEQRQVRPHFTRGLVTHPHLRFARFQQHLVKLAPHRFVAYAVPQRWWLGKILPVFASGHLVEDFSETEEVGGDGSRAFRRYVSLRAGKGDRRVGLRDQSDVREFWHAVHKDDV